MTQPFRPQSGAALVIGLILLSVLTLLATSTIGTAALQLTMAGNDQYYARAFQAAEIGIASTIAAYAFDPAAPSSLTDTVSGGDRYEVVVHPRGATAAPPGFSPTFIAEHYLIESTGSSHREATLALAQGVFLIKPPLSPPPASATPPLCDPGVEYRPGVCVAFDTVVRTYWHPVQ